MSEVCKEFVPICVFVSELRITRITQITRIRGLLGNQRISDWMWYPTILFTFQARIR